MVCFSPDAKPAATRSAQPRCVPSGIVSPSPSVKLSPLATYRVTSSPSPGSPSAGDLPARLPNGCVREGMVVTQIARSGHQRPDLLGDLTDEGDRVGIVGGGLQNELGGAGFDEFAQA